MLGIQMKFNEQGKSIEIIEAETPKEPTARYQRVYSPIKEIPSNFVAIDFEIFTRIVGLFDAPWP